MKNLISHRIDCGARLEDSVLSHFETELETKIAKYYSRGRGANPLAGGISSC